MRETKRDGRARGKERPGEKRREVGVGEVGKKTGEEWEKRNIFAIGKRTKRHVDLWLSSMLHLSQHKTGS